MEVPMIDRQNDDNEEQRDLTLITGLVLITIVAAGVFLTHSAGTRYANVASAPGALNDIPVMTPAIVPNPDTVPQQ